MKVVRLFIFLLLPFTCFSQNNRDTLDLLSLSLEELINVKVSVASNVVEDLRKQPVSVTTITHEQLELSGARTLLDAIMIFVPGVFVVEDQDDTIIGFRGLAADNNSKVLLLVNGINLNTEFFWGPPGAILNSTNYDYIERVEVVRGPGSVTLGQGALLGVINIVTKNADDVIEPNKLKSNIWGTAGLDGLFGANGHFAIKGDGGFSAFMTGGVNHYNGQSLRHEGWANDRANEGYLGGSVADIGTRLKRSENENFLAGITYNDFKVSVMYFNQNRDLYNFYRDRNRMRQTQWTTSLEYNKSINEKLSISASANYSNDDFGLSSVDGYIMGGTKESRSGAKFVLKSTAIKNHNIAVGGEYRNFDVGHENRRGHNFINNLISDDVMDPNYFEESNENKQWVFEQHTDVFSFFLEDYFQVRENLALFAALRFDNHTFWEPNISPRVGSFFQASEKLSFKLTYQEGFRGAVGVFYSGGFKQDGFLEAANFDQVAGAAIPVFDANNVQTGIEQNLPNTKPEKISSTELTINYDFSDHLNFSAVTFYNRVKNVLDVGVIVRDPVVWPLPNIGSDIPGDWNGYWFFKNTEGSIDEIGFEGSLIYKSNRLYTTLSHSMVQVVSADEQQKGSMYLNEQNNFTAYPQNVTRLNTLVSLGSNFSLGANYLYYYGWFSPSNQAVAGNHLMSASLKYHLLQSMDLSIHGLNLLGANNLYPMTNNVNDPSLSDGTPAVEKTSFWVKVNFNF
ncbi:MAG: TonB-dependent receptor plug domain-containing protein [bacterium]|nr:TonB-dependent receptor plug domain-containing protein [bacterium]